MRPWVLALLVNSILASAVVAAPLVYTGYAVSFTKPAGADFTLPINQDRILSDIIITRGNSAGIFNIAQEEAFELNVSPLGTAWAFPNNNPSATLSASNWQALVFEDWQTANGGPGNGPPATVGQDAVIHLIDQDIYLDIRFTGWGVSSGAGGSFAYERAEITAVPEPNGLFMAAIASLSVITRHCRRDNYGAHSICNFRWWIAQSRK